jgi:hypothetical protein
MLYGKLSKLASNVNHMNINVVIAVILKMVKNFTCLKSAESSPSTYFCSLTIYIAFPIHGRAGGGGRKHEGKNGRGKKTVTTSIKK